MSDTAKWVEEVHLRLHEKIQDQAQKMDLPALVGQSPWTLRYAEVCRFKILLAEERNPFTEEVREPKIFNGHMDAEERRALKYQTVLINPDHQSTSPQYWLDLEKYFHKESWKLWEGNL